MSNENSNTGAHVAASVGNDGTVVPHVAANTSPAAARRLAAETGEIVFEILVAVMWSDGELVTSEVERGRAAADLMCVRPKRGGALGAIADGPLPFPAIAFERLDPYARSLTYAAACWLDDASEAPSERRASFIGAIRMKLDLSDDHVERLRGLATAVGQQFPEPRDAFEALMQRV